MKKSNSYTHQISSEISDTIDTIIIKNNIGKIDISFTVADDVTGEAVLKSDEDRQDILKIEHISSALVIEAIKNDKEENIDLTIKIPENMQIKVLHNVGDIAINNAKKPVSVCLNCGNIKVADSQSDISLLVNVGKAELKNINNSTSCSVNMNVGSISVSKEIAQRKYASDNIQVNAGTIKYT